MIIRRVDTASKTISLGSVSPTKAGERFEALDVLRGVAALGVFLFHLGPRVNRAWLEPRGYLAVDFFFVLSGLVIARAYRERLCTDVFTRRFIASRIIRLWPMVLMGSALATFVLIHKNHGNQTGDIAAAGIFACLLIPAWWTPPSLSAAS